jgi:tetratricopeptide (TPR) repeat protein
MDRLIEWLTANATPISAIAGMGAIAALLWARSKGLYHFFHPDKKSEDIKLDVNKLVEDLTQLAGEKRDLTAQLENKEQEIAQLREAVEALEDRQSEPGVADAIAHLEEGDTSPAIQIFEHDAEGAAANKEAATAWRHLGAIVYLNDTKKSLEAYEKAVGLDPENPDGWNRLGLLKKRIGDLDAAENSYRNVLRLGEEAKDKGAIAAATGNLGIIYQTRGELNQAKDYQLKALAMDEELGRKENMAASYDNLGIVFGMRGSRTEPRSI